MNILLTGANSHLGHHCILNLLESGYTVHALLRNKSKLHLEAHPKLKLYEGSFMDESCLNRIEVAIDYVVHIASDTRQNLCKLKNYNKVNLEGTKLLFTWASQKHVKRFIYVSSTNAIGHGDDKNPGHEGLLPRIPFSKSLYAQSKIQTQQWLLQQESSTKLIILNPSFMLGSYDSRPSSGKIIQMNFEKRFHFYPCGGKSFVNAKDVAQAIRASLSKGRDKECYLLCNENMSYKDFYKKLAQHQKRKSTLVAIPNFTLSILGIFGEAIRMLGIRSSLSRSNMQVLKTKNYYSNAKARKELGMEFHPIDQGIEDCISWFKEMQMIKKRN